MLTRILFHIAAGLSGLLTYLVVSAFIGWESAIWWGGEALFPMVFGGIALVAGAVLFDLMYGAYIRLQKDRSRLPASILGGVVLGITLLPIQRLAASFMTGLPFWSKIEPSTAVWIVLAFAWCCSAIIGLLAARLTARRGSRGEGITEN